MYNPDFKNSFIETCLGERIHRGSVSVTSVRAWFSFTERFEEELNKDAAFFSRDEAVAMFKAWSSRSVSSLQNMASVMRKYAEFCSGENAYKELTKTVLKSECLAAEATKGALLTREDITRIQSGMRNAVDKAILECLFIGISGKQLMDLTDLCASQLDNLNGILTLQSGKTVHLTRAQVSLLEAAFEENESHSYYIGQASCPVDGVGFLCKKKPNAVKADTPERKFRWIQRRFAIWQEYFDLPVLTMKSVAMSGLVHEIRSGMCKTGLSLRDFLKSETGRTVAAKFDFTSESYVSVVYDKVKIYFE